MKQASNLLADFSRSLDQAYDFFDPMFTPVELAANAADKLWKRMHELEATATPFHTVFMEWEPGKPTIMGRLDENGKPIGEPTAVDAKSIRITILGQRCPHCHEVISGNPL